jgi:hypothetical protein
MEILIRACNGGNGHTASQQLEQRSNGLSPETGCVIFIVILEPAKGWSRTPLAISFLRNTLHRRVGRRGAGPALALTSDDPARCKPLIAGPVPHPNE